MAILSERGCGEGLLAETIQHFFAAFPRGLGACLAQFSPELTEWELTRWEGVSPSIPPPTILLPDIAWGPPLPCVGVFLLSSQIGSFAKSLIYPRRY